MVRNRTAYLGRALLRLSVLFRKVVVCGHCVVTLSITSYCRNIKMALIAAHLNAEVILVVTVIVATTSIPPPVLPVPNNLYDFCGR